MINNNVPEICKILGAMCDNTSSNDTLVEHLETLAPYFEGASSHVQCVLHVTNLVAKSMLKLFDASQKEGSLVGKIADEVLNHSGSNGDDNVDAVGPGGAEEEEDDNVEGWINEAELLTDDEHAVLDMHVQLLWKLLVKVSALAEDEIHTIKKQSYRSESCPSKLFIPALFFCLHGWLC